MSNSFKIIFSFQKVPESKWRCKVSEKALGGEGVDNHLLKAFHKKLILLECQEYCVKTGDAHWGPGRTGRGIVRRSTTASSRDGFTLRS